MNPCDWRSQRVKSSSPSPGRFSETPWRQQVVKSCRYADVRQGCHQTSVASGCFRGRCCRKLWNLPWNLQKSRGKIMESTGNGGVAGLPWFSRPPNLKSGKMSWNQCETPWFFSGKSSASPVSSRHMERIMGGGQTSHEYSLTILPCFTSFHWGQIYRILQLCIHFLWFAYQVYLLHSCEFTTLGSPRPYTSYHCETLYPLREWDDSR